jgi:hypothetical protein
VSHTPAPWIAIVWEETVFVGGPDDDEIAEFSFADEVLQDSYISKDEAIANATLCAAAPDLLAALQALLPDAGWCDDLPRVKQARAAIAKATVVS